METRHVRHLLFPKFVMMRLHPPRKSFVLRPHSTGECKLGRVVRRRFVSHTVHPYATFFGRQWRGTCVRARSRRGRSNRGWIIR